MANQCCCRPRLKRGGLTCIKRGLIIKKDGELRHYGVKGMKWGVRKEYEPVGRKKSKHRQKLEEKYRSKGMNSNEAEKAADKRIRREKIVAGSAAAALVAAYGYKLVNSGEFNRLAAKGKAWVQGQGFTMKKNPSLADPTMNAEDIFCNVVQSRINPDYGIAGLTGLGTKTNCRRCTFAYELRRRGFDVRATNAMGDFTNGQTGIGLYNATHEHQNIGFLGFIHKLEKGASISEFTGTKILTPPRRQAKSIFDSLSTYPEGARGELSLMWSKGGGHSLAWEIVGGQPKIFDCQLSEMYDSADNFPSYMAESIKEAYLTRLDDKNLNYDFLLKWVKNSNF